MPGNIQVVVGGQYGSEAKGAVAAHLARWRKSDLLAIRVAGPNAGHTAVDDRGRTWRLRQIPVAAVVNSFASLAIGPGSEIDTQVLDREVYELEKAGFSIQPRLYIDSSATMIEPRHKQQEGELIDRIGSTGKGVGAARAERIQRVAEVYGGEHNVADFAQAWLARDGTVQVEGTQGYGLGLHGEHYPWCTSSDCRAIDFLAMAGLSPWAASYLEVWVVLRSYPIRVAGKSGPLHNEMTWEQLAEQSGGHIQPEYTTVTNKLRRVGDWDTDLAYRALRANGHPSQAVRVALTHIDYWLPHLAGKTGIEVLDDSDFASVLKGVEDELQCRVDLVGTGPGAYTEVGR